MSGSDSDLAVIFLHHFGGSSRTWHGVISRLPGIRCLAVDLRGFGGSHADDGCYRLVDYVKDVRRFVAGAGVTEFVLVGHSMGGKIAMAAVADGLPGTDSLVLLAPSPPSPEPIAEDVRARLRTVLERGAGAEVVSGATARPLTAALFELAVADVSRSAPDAWKAWLDDGSREDITRSIRDLKIPTWVFSGAKDKYGPTDVIRTEVVDRIDGATLSTIPDAGHLLPLEVPASVATAIRTVVQLRTARRTHASWSSPASVTYPRGHVHDLVASDAVTDATRRALTARDATRSLPRARFFTTHELATLSATCTRLIPQPQDRAAIDLAVAIDERLALGKGNGWRYASMPPDGCAYRRSLRALDGSARARFDQTFDRLTGAQQDQLLAEIQYREVVGASWGGLSASRFLEELLAEVSEIYFSHAIVQAEIGYAGMADVGGWSRIGLNQLEDIEPRPTEIRRG